MQFIVTAILDVILLKAPPPNRDPTGKN